MKKTAILLGATGLTGGLLLELLLQDSQIEKVKYFGRSSVNISHPKLEEHLGDLFKMEHFSEVFKGDMVFCCIGTTKAKTRDKELYKKIDYGIPLAAAKLANVNDVDIFEVISAMGANPKSSAFYNRVKGEMERDLLKVGIKKTFVFQPSLIGGNRDEKRLGERIAQVAMRTFNFLIPDHYKMIQPETIAKAMHKVAFNGYQKTTITSDVISELGK